MCSQVEQACAQNAALSSALAAKEGELQAAKRQAGEEGQRAAGAEAGRDEAVSELQRVKMQVGRCVWSSQGYTFSVSEYLHVCFYDVCRPRTPSRRFTPFARSLPL